jgi:hypothetical protein
MWSRSNGSDRKYHDLGPSQDRRREIEWSAVNPTSKRSWLEPRRDFKRVLPSVLELARAKNRYVQPSAYPTGT